MKEESLAKSVHKIHAEGTELVMDLAKAQDPSIEFFRMPRKSKTSLLFRFIERDGSTADKWYPLMIKATRSLNRQHHKYVFSYPRKNIVGPSICVVPAERLVFVNQFMKGRASSRPAVKQLFSSFHVEDSIELESLAFHLRGLLTELPSFRLDDAIAEFSSAQGQVRANQTLLNETKRRVWDRCDFGFQYFDGEEPFNSMVQNWQVLHRSVEVNQKPNVNRSGLYVNVCRFVAGSQGVPYSVEDRFDFFVAMVHDKGVLQGLFVLPRRVIDHVFVSPTSRGRKCMYLYRPDAPSVRKNVVKKVKEQQPYYVDLSDPCTIEESLEKVKHIFKTEENRLNEENGAKNLDGAPLQGSNQRSSTSTSVGTFSNMSIQQRSFSSGPRGRGSSSGFLPFEEARAYVRQLGLKSFREWKIYSKTDRPSFIPGDPFRTCKDEWTCYSDWMGYEKRQKGKNFLSFVEAREFVRKLELKSTSEWKEYCKTGRPDTIPASPEKVYKSEWISFNDWCGHARLPPPRRTNFLKWAQGKRARKRHSSDPAAWFENFLATNIKNIELFRLPHDVQGSYLMKFKDASNASAADESGVRLFVRFSAEENPDRGRFTFSHGAYAVNDALIGIRTTGKTLYFVHGRDIRTKHIRIPSPHYTDVRIDGTDEIEATLRQWHSELPQRSLADCIRDKLGSSKGCGSKLLFQAKEFFDRSNLPIKFLPMDSDANVMFGDYRVFHRMLTPKKIGVGYEAHFHANFLVDGQDKCVDFPHNFDCEIDCVMGTIHEDETLKGFFFFPKSSVKEYFTVGETPGKRAGLFYPPFVSPRYDSTRARQKRESAYYIDLSDPENWPMAEAKLRSILAEIDAFKKSGQNVEDAAVLTEKQQN